MKKILCMVNAAAGTGTAKSNLYEIVETLARRDCEVTVYPILPSKGMTSEELIRLHGGQYDVLMCAGGDGTLSHTIRGVMKEGLDKPLAYLPCGSTNDYAKSIGIPASVKKNCAAVAGGKTVSLDIGKFNGESFNYVAAFGAFTKVSYSTSQEIKNVLGYAAYVLEGIHTLQENISTRCHLRISHDGIQEEGNYFFGAVTNSTSIGGMNSPLSQMAKLDDGLFEVVLITAPENFTEIGELIKTLTSGSTDSPYVHVFQTGALRIKALNNVEWTLDGEYGGNPKTVNIDVCRKAIRLLVP